MDSHSATFKTRLNSWTKLSEALASERLEVDASHWRRYEASSGDRRYRYGECVDVSHSAALRAQRRTFSALTRAEARRIVLQRIGERWLLGRLPLRPLGDGSINSDWLLFPTGVGSVTYKLGLPLQDSESSLGQTRERGYERTWGTK